MEQIIITKKLIEGFAAQLRMDEKSKNTLEVFFTNEAGRSS